MALALIVSLANLAKAQDSANGKEPIVDSIDPSTLKYDYLVDGSLPQDDPTNKQFKTLQAAYDAAPAGTADKPTVIGIKPDVYLIPAAPDASSLTVEKNYITFLGLTNNRRAVVIADNRGHAQGAVGNGIVLDVNATGFTMKNLTVLNYCNVDYEYPGMPRKNLSKRSDVITQAVAFQSRGDKHFYQNVAFLSRLDTTFMRTMRSYLKDVYIEGTDDFIGGGTVGVWENCQIIFPTGSGVMAASNIAFINCQFQSTRGMQFSKTPGRPVALIDCVLPVNTDDNPVSWVRGKTHPKANFFSLTYHTRDAAGHPAAISDGSQGPRTFTYSREMSDEERLAFNPWNMLRAAPTGNADDWDPAQARDKYEAAKQGSLVYRMNFSDWPTNSIGPSIRTGGKGAKLAAVVMPARADQTVKWSTDSNLVALSQTSGSDVVVTGQNTTDDPQTVAVNATAANGYYITAWVFVEPKYVDPPAFTAAPSLEAPANGSIHVNYTLDLAGRHDQSLVSWYACDDATGANPRPVAVSCGNVPLRDYILTPGDVGKYIRVGVEPKHQVSDPGPAVFAVSAKPVAASDVPSSTVTLNFTNFVEKPTAGLTDLRWLVSGAWQVVTGENFTNGYGLRVGSAGAELIYQHDADTGDMQIDLVMTPEKTAGSGFGSPGSGNDGSDVQKSDVFIKYDPKTKTGYSLRFWRTTLSAEKVMFQFYKIENGAGTPLDNRNMLTGAFKPSTFLTVKVVGNTISAEAHNTADSAILSLNGTIAPNHFGGAGVDWTGSVPRGNSNVYSLIRVSYPEAAAGGAGN
jgi:hypothetical protein